MKQHTTVVFLYLSPLPDLEDHVKRQVYVWHQRNPRALFPLFLVMPKRSNFATMRSTHFLSPRFYRDSLMAVILYWKPRQPQRRKKIGIAVITCFTSKAACVMTESVWWIQTTLTEVHDSPAQSQGVSETDEFLHPGNSLDHRICLLLHPGVK